MRSREFRRPTARPRSNGTATSRRDCRLSQVFPGHEVWAAWLPPRLEPEVLLQRRRQRAPAREPSGQHSPNCPRRARTTASADGLSGDLAQSEAKHALQIGLSESGQIVAQKAHVVLQQRRSSSATRSSAVARVKPSYRKTTRESRQLAECPSRRDSRTRARQRRPGCRNGRSAFRFVLSVGTPSLHVFRGGFATASPKRLGWLKDQRPVASPSSRWWFWFV